MSIIAGIIVGFVAWFVLRYLLAGIYTVNQDQRAVKTIFGRAERVGNATTLDDPISEHLKPEERATTTLPLACSTRAADSTPSSLRKISNGGSV